MFSNALPWCNLRSGKQDMAKADRRVSLTEQCGVSPWGWRSWPKQGMKIWDAVSCCLQRSKISHHRCHSSSWISPFIRENPNPAGLCLLTAWLWKIEMGLEPKALPRQSLLSGNYKWSKGRTAVRILLSVKTDLQEVCKYSTVPVAWQHGWLKALGLFIT